jgi:hypothetical protein
MPLVPSPRLVPQINIQGSATVWLTLHALYHYHIYYKPTKYMYQEIKIPYYFVLYLI